MSFVVRIGSVADTAAIEKTGDALHKVGSEADVAKSKLSDIGTQADASTDSLKRLQNEFRTSLDSTQQQPDAAGLQTPDSAAPGLLGGLTGPTAAAGAAYAAYNALSAAVASVREHLAMGLEAAAGFNEQLRTLPTEKADELRVKLGPLADLIDANSVALEEFAQKSADADLEAEKFWTTIAVRAVPALNELRDAAKGPETSDLANRLGTDLSGAAHLAASGISGLDSVLQKGKTSIDDVASKITAQLFPGLKFLETALNAAGNAWQGYDEQQQAAARSAQEQARLAAAQASTTEAITAARTSALEAQLPLEERLIAVRERQAALIDAANNGDEKSRKQAADLEKELVALDAQIAKQKEAEDQKRSAQQAAADDYEQRLRLQEATNAGEQNTIDLLKQEIAYRAALKATGDSGIAERAASAEADAQEARRKEAAAKKQADAKKGQAETDKKSQQAEEAYKKQQEILQAKRDELELETRINEAKAVGNQAEVAKLEWIKEYNSLLDKGATDDEARRAANATSAVRSTNSANPESTPSAYVAPGEIVPGSNYRRGMTQSDTSFAYAQADQTGGSLLDAYMANQNTPVGAIGGKSILPADPLQSADASGNAISGSGQEDPGKGAADEAKKLGDLMKKGFDNVAKNLADAIKSADMSGVSSAVGSLGASMARQISDLQKQIDSIANKI